MTPNATVSYMAAQAERRLVDAKAARAWLADEVARDRAPGSGLTRLTPRVRAMLAVCIHRHRGTVESTQTRPHAALGMADPAR